MVGHECEELCYVLAFDQKGRNLKMTSHYLEDKLELFNSKLQNSSIFRFWSQILIVANIKSVS